MSSAMDADRDRPLLIGLTGPIGCGKSTIAVMLRDLGGDVIDADQLARQVTVTGAPVLAHIRRRFGDNVFAADGALDRTALARVVFGDPAALADLEALTHPLVRKLVDERLADAARDRVPFVAVEAIKLVEGGLAARCDVVWLVDCSPAVQRQRLLSRGTPEVDAAQRMATQGDDLAERLAGQLAGVPGGPSVRRLVTDGSLEETRTSVEDALADALAPLLD
jgi:dephospho-CoA kinase